MHQELTQSRDILPPDIAPGHGNAHGSHTYEHPIRRTVLTRLVSRAVLMTPLIFTAMRHKYIISSGIFKLGCLLHSYCELGKPHLNHIELAKLTCYYSRRDSVNGCTTPFPLTDQRIAKASHPSNLGKIAWPMAKSFGLLLSTLEMIKSMLGYNQAIDFSQITH